MNRGATIEMGHRNKPLYLLAFGAFVMALSMIVKHNTAVNDGAFGVFQGIGIGMMIVALIFSAKQRKAARKAG